MRLPPLAFLSLVLLAACAPPHLPEPPTPYLAVRGRRLRRAWGPIRNLAVHTYVTWRTVDARLPLRSERLYSGVHQHTDPWDPDHETYALLRGDDAIAAIQRLEPVLAEDPQPEPYQSTYLAFPGPNSNSYTRELCRRAQLPVDLPASAVGKDWPTLLPHVLDFGLSSTRTGLHLDLLSVLGLQVGLTEGVELHVLGLSLGFDLWPPALRLPVIGRLGAWDTFD